MFYAFRAYVLATQRKCVPAFKDFARCLCMLDQTEFRLYWQHGTRRRRACVGFMWEAKEDPANPKTKDDAATIERQLIDASMRQLLTAAWASPK
jgi:hypothetical protein